MAHKKGQGSTRNGRDSNPQYLGIKLYAGETAKAGAIIVRQCGTPFKAGYMVGTGKDCTLYALCEGKVRFRNHKIDIIPTDESIPQYTAISAS